MSIKLIKTITIFLTIVGLTSCSTQKLVTHAVAYQSLRPVKFKPEIPKDAKIILSYRFTPEGEVIVHVKNNTNEIMIIDQTKSFLVNSDGKSISYYDPTVRVESTTTSESKTRGGTVNLGPIANVLGVGGKAAYVASGINVGGANTEGTSSTNTTYFKDEPQISLGPQGSGYMSKEYKVAYLGISSISSAVEQNDTYTPEKSYCKFSVCISFSIDGGKTFDKVVTDFYVNSRIVCPVRSHGRVNDALRTLMSTKTDCLNEPCWLIFFNSNINANNTMHMGVIRDYK